MSRIPTRLPSSNGNPISSTTHHDAERPLRAIMVDEEPSLLMVTIDDERREFGPGEFTEPSSIESLQNTLRMAQRVVCDITALSSWELESRGRAVRLFGDLVTGRRNVTFAVGGVNVGQSLFDAAIQMIVNDPVLRYPQANIELAVDAAIVEHPAEIPFAKGRIGQRIRAVRIPGFGSREINRLVEHRRRDLQEQQTATEPTNISDLIPGVANDDLRCPDGWVITPQGVMRRGTIALTTPIVIVRRLIEDQTGCESVELAWNCDGRTRRRIVGRLQIAKARDIVELAGLGVGITSNSAAEAVQYFADFESENRQFMPAVRLTRHMGWQGPECDRFLWGRQVLCEPPLAVGDAAPVVFVGMSDGDEQLVDGFHAEGTSEGWLEIVRPLQSYPRVLLALYTSLASALLAVVNTTNFILSFAGSTSIGKTTAARLGASVWGRPHEGEPSAAIGSWSATHVWIERASSILGSLPFVIDDTRNARHPEIIPRTVYGFCSGRGAGRGALQGTVRVDNWRAAMITTGEVSLTSFSEQGGTRARVIEVWGSPFNGTSSTTAADVGTVNTEVLQHFGHAGPNFVRFILANRVRWLQWREHFGQLREHYQRRAGGNHVAARMAQHFAVLRLAEVLAHEALSMPWACGNVVDELWPELTRETTDADRAGAALDFMISWTNAHRAEFLHGDVPTSNTNAPSSGWAGRWEVRGRNGEETVLTIYPHRVNDLLRQQNFDPDAMRRTWRDREWVRCSPNKLTLKARITGVGTEEVVAIRWSVIRHRLEDGAEPQQSVIRRRGHVGGDGEQIGDSGSNRSQVGV